LNWKLKATNVMSAHLSAQDVQVDFGDVSALGPVSVHIKAGEFVALVGPSGCGKSTLIRAFAGLQVPSQGTVQIDNVRIRKPSPRVGLMFQAANLMPWRSVVDNIALPLELAGMEKQARYDQVDALLPMLGLEGFAQALPNALSGGMAQRVALGRVLIAQPDVLLLDEPFGALDAMTREQIGLDFLTMLQNHPKTVVMVTHDVHEAVLMADRVLVMSQRPGRIIADIRVDLPRPRRLDMVYEPNFAQIALTIRDNIRNPQIL
jgi:NitT/TauT family transport system ATP-binding protein